MRLISHMTGIAFALLMTAGTALCADPVTDPTAGESNRDPLTGQAVTAMKICSDLWVIKTHDELDTKFASLIADRAQSEAILKSDIDRNERSISAKKEEIKTLTGSFDKSLEKTAEDALKTGLEINSKNIKELTTALTSNSTNEADIEKLHRAEQELAALEKQQSLNRVAYAGIGGLRTAVSLCVDDQRQYLGARAATTTTTPVAASVRKMLGTWTVKCGDDTGGFSFEGPFVLDFTVAAEGNKEGIVNGEVQMDKQTYPLKGIWFKDTGTVTANADIAGDGQPWTFAGDAAEHSGQLVSAGTVTGKFGDDMPCKGSYNGQEKN